MLITSHINGLRKLLLVIDISLFLMVVLYFPAGFGWLNDETIAEGAQGEPATLSRKEVKRQLDQFAYENEQLQRELDLKLAQASELEQELAQTKRSSYYGQETFEAAEAARLQTEKKTKELNNKINDKQKLLEILEKERIALEKLLHQLRDIDKEKAQLAQQLRKLEVRSIGLKEKVAEARRKQLEGRTIHVQSTPLVNLNTERSPAYVALLKATVVPVAEPYYTFSQLIVPRSNGDFELVSKVSRNGSTGESVDEALIEGSDFLNFLEKIDPRKDFVAMLVDSSSFETFRAVRELLRNRGVAFGWLPCSTPSSFYLRSRGGVLVREFRQ